jgi:hypothetical protein
MGGNMKYQIILSILVTFSAFAASLNYTGQIDSRKYVDMQGTHVKFENKVKACIRSRLEGLFYKCTNIVIELTTPHQGGELTVTAECKRVPSKKRMGKIVDACEEKAHKEMK